MSGLHQFIRVGAHAMIGFQTRLSQDLPPFVTAAGNPAEAQGINAEGLKRRGFGPERIEVIKQMHRLLYRRSLTLADAKQQIGELPEARTTSAADVELMLDFLATAQRGIVR
jgi:UDP-N-acetylglucosamine acyltransferase